MGMYHIGIVFLGLVPLPHSAVASDDDVLPESSVSTPAMPPSAPAASDVQLPSPAASIKRAVFSSYDVAERAPQLSRDRVQQRKTVVETNVHEAVNSAQSVGPRS